MSRPRSIRSQFKGLAAVPISGNKEPATRGVPPAFDGTIASACESVGISLERMIEMMRWARESDPKAAQFLDTWDALDPCERQLKGTAEAVRQRVGLKLPELLGIIAEVACRIAMYQAQIIAALSGPLVVHKTIDLALDDSAKAKDRLAAQIVLHKATGFLPVPKGSQTIFSIFMQNAPAPTAAQPIAAPRPEDTIRSLSDRFNEVRALRPAVRAALPKEGNK
jgi:hypothetical protein